MTDQNQKRLAEAIGEKEGYHVMGKMNPMNGSFLWPLPVFELVEIAEKRFRKDGAMPLIDIHITEDGVSCRWMDSGLELGFAVCPIEQEARMTCAIEGLRKLRQEKEKES